MRLHHVQVACPTGGEAVARRFYRDTLGMNEVQKPADLRARGGVWFRSVDDTGETGDEIHVGVEDSFRPARKAHPALLLDSAAELDALRRRLEAAGYEVDLSQRDTFPGHERVHAFDGHGNRVELLAADVGVEVKLPTGNVKSMSQVLSLWNALSRVPVVGRPAFSLVFSQKAPYFATIRPRFVEIRPNRAELVIAKRRGVHNHLKTVHAIALCNGLEAAMGALAEATIPADRRWIPRGMEVAYTARATTDITCIAETDARQWASEEPDLPVRVRGVRDDGTVVIEGVIRLWVTPRSS